VLSLKLYLVRHGESATNLINATSKYDTPLTEKGKKDAENAGKILKGNFDRVFVSPYLRAIQTRQYALPDVNAEILDCIREFYLGDVEGMLYEDLYKRYPLFKSHCAVDDFTSYGGESYAQVRERVREFMSFLQSIDAERVVAFSHAGYILTFFDEVMGRDGKPGRNISISNGSVSVFSFNGSKWKVEAFNVTSDFF
jgi:probable phosphoglycerate mutase